MENELRESLLALSAGYQAETGLSAATIGTRAAGDSKFFARIEGGASFEIRTYDAVVAWFRSNWPPRAAWPKGRHGPRRIAAPRVAKRKTRRA